MAPSVWTGGSRHAGLAALPHKNIHLFLLRINFDNAIYLFSLIIYLCFQTWFLNLVFKDADDVRRVKFVFSIYLILIYIYNLVATFKDNASDTYACYAIVLLAGIVLLINNIKHEDKDYLL